MIALVLGIHVWHILLFITIASFLIVKFYPYRPCVGGVIPLPNPEKLISWVLCIIANLIMWLIYFIVN